MQIQEAIHTLLEAQDFYAISDFRHGAAPLRGEPARPEPPPAMPHDFLVLCPEPALAPDLFPDKGNPTQSCERNMPAR